MSNPTKTIMQLQLLLEQVSESVNAEQKDFLSKLTDAFNNVHLVASQSELVTGIFGKNHPSLVNLLQIQMNSLTRLINGFKSRPLEATTDQASITELLNEAVQFLKCVSPKQAVNLSAIPFTATTFGVNSVAPPSPPSPRLSF